MHLFKLTLSFSFRTVRRALPEVCLARPRSARQRLARPRSARQRLARPRSARQRLARASPRRKQKYDRYPQPTPFSQGSCVLVRQEIPATNTLFTGFEFDEFVANTLVVMYAKCREFGDSRRLFDAIPERNVVSWSALFSCYVRSDFHGESMDLFQEMILSGVRPNEYSLSRRINACTGLGDGSHGRKIHGYMVRIRLILSKCAC
ncbi:hypothetical protein ACFX13_037499 [Malus domestica]